MKRLMILAFALLASPALAATPEQEALAKELLVCAGKFGSLVFIGVSGGEAESVKFFDAATRIAGDDFVNRETKPANERAADWIFSKDKPGPTLKQARKSCLPLLAKAASDS